MKFSYDWDGRVAHLGCKLKQTLFSDDKPENVAGAIAVGLHGHVHAGPASLRALLATLRIADLG
ncbi:MAG: hypothetical protein ACRCUE_05735 [Bosea sp. (in: a-proteobacteria)]